MGSVALPTECFLVRKGERGLGGMNSIEGINSNEMFGAVYKG